MKTLYTHGACRRTVLRTAVPAALILPCVEQRGHGVPAGDAEQLKTRDVQRADVDILS